MRADMRLLRVRDGTVAGMLEYLDYSKRNGDMDSRTADARKSACSRVLSVDDPGWQSASVHDLDLDDRLERFDRSARGHSLKAVTLTAYRHRVRSAVDLYLKFLSDPQAAGATGETKRSSTLRGPGEESSASSTGALGPASQPSSSAGPLVASLVTYPFPLRSGGMAYLQLPRHLSGVDVRRMCTFLGSLAIDSSDDAEEAGR